MVFLLIVTLVSLTLAAIMSVVAWRVAGEERRRADARIAALSADIHGADVVSPPRPVPASARFDDLAFRRAPEPAFETQSGVMFETARERRGGLPVPAIVGIGALVFVLAAGAAMMLTGGSTTSAAPVTPAREKLATPSKPATPATTLELVALGHERDGDRLTVRGVVRNPTSDALGNVTAVVFLFDRDGGFLTSGRATIDSTTLAPGGESTFIVTVPRAADVGRYRVSFRTADRIVPHVDRREHLQAKS